MSKRKKTLSINRRDLIARSGKAALALWCSSKSYAEDQVWALDEEPKYVDHLVIGSGFGGAMTAYHLTQKGLEVAILEQGRRWDQPQSPGERRFSPLLYPDGRSTWLEHSTVTPLGPRLPVRKTTGVLQGRKLGSKTLLNGAAWGGGSITWGGVAVIPEKTLFKKVYGDRLHYEELEPYWELLQGRFPRSVIPADVLDSSPYTHARIAQSHNIKAQLHNAPMSSATNWDIVRQELRGELAPSVIHGEAIYGVSNGAKYSLDQNYLRDAERSGLLDIHCLHQVKELALGPEGRYAVIVDQLDEDGLVIKHKLFYPRSVYLAAGCVSTLGLLIRARDMGLLPELNQNLGAGFGNNGNAYGMRALLKEKTGTIQGGPPSIGIEAHDHPLAGLFVEHPQFPLPLDTHALLYFSIGLSPTRGRFYYDQRTKKLALDWPTQDAGQEKVNQALLDLCRSLNAANGGVTTSALKYFSGQIKDDMCFHTLGGAVLGEAVDRYGRIREYPGLYINDGSLLPGSSACVNPAMTIAALASRNIVQIIAEDLGL